jgi:hypothetical protein
MMVAIRLMAITNETLELYTWNLGLKADHKRTHKFVWTAFYMLTMRNGEVVSGKFIAVGTLVNGKCKKKKKKNVCVIYNV